MPNELIQSIDLLHTTELGVERIKKNLKIDAHDIVQWCKEQTLQADEIVRQGKNWYVYANESVITVNAHSYTIITAHKNRNPRQPDAKPVNIDDSYTKNELTEALRAINSTISKCEKVLPKLPAGKSQHTLMVRRIKALQIAVTLITRELESAYGK